MKNCAKRLAEQLERRDLLAADIGLERSMPLPGAIDDATVSAMVGHADAGGHHDDGAPPHRSMHPHMHTPGDGPLIAIEPRTIDGSDNNPADPELGSANTTLLRITSVEYADGYSEPSGADRPSAREVSNAVVTQTTTEPNDRDLTDLTWLWGQFIDHDIDLTEAAYPAEAFDIEVPFGDEYFDPDGTGDATIDFYRSVYDTDAVGDYREQINEISAFLDGSVIYGSDEQRAAELRTFEGGQLATSDGDLLPFNETGLDNAGGTSDTLFLAGDVRANENVALTAMQTLWVREHNRIADDLAVQNPSLSDEEIYQQARAIVVGEMQAITYNEYLPALLGEDALSQYEGYDPTVDPGISAIFSTASYRFGHSMLTSELLRIDGDGTVAEEGNLSLQNAFFAPGEIIDNGIESLLLGASVQVANEIDTQIVDDVRNFLFGEPGSDGFDLAALNIQRGRDHGLADYNQSRIDLGLEPVSEFSDITSDPLLATALEDLYGSVDNIDVWVGALAEDHVAGSSLGELNQTVIADQFERIRDGDRFWYQNVFSGRQLSEIEGTTLADVIERNTDIEGLQENVFFAADAQPQDQGGHDSGTHVDHSHVDTNRVDVKPAEHDQLNDREIRQRAIAPVPPSVLMAGESGETRMSQPRPQRPSPLQPIQPASDAERIVDEVFADPGQIEDLRFFFVSEYLAKRRR